jgi:(p)ppGpp synthase/HD superfamily hydrolase
MENKETFRARLLPYLPPSAQEQVRLAYILAKFGHRAQTRKEIVNGKPLRYFEHVRSVALILMDELKIMDKNMIISALLHDALEDTEDITASLIEATFGEEPATLIALLSKVPKEGYHERLSNCHNWKALTIKLCDRLDNLNSLMAPGTSHEFHKKQIKETVEVYFPLFDHLLEICPVVYLNNIKVVRDKIHALIARYSSIVELNEKSNIKEPA